MLATGLSIAIHIRIHIVSQFFFLTVGKWAPSVVSGPLLAKFSSWLKPLVTPLVCCLHQHVSKQLMVFFFSRYFILQIGNFVYCIHSYRLLPGNILT